MLATSLQLGDFGLDFTNFESQVSMKCRNQPGHPHFRVYYKFVTTKFFITSLELKLMN